MGYSVKWIFENLGITREMLRHYEREKLISRSEKEGLIPWNIEYSDEDVVRIWSIKFLIELKFTIKEIREFENNPNWDFYSVFSKKLEAFEKKHEEGCIFLQFAKTIKMTGRIPTPSQLGSMTFKDFLSYSYQYWNIFNDPANKKFMAVADTFLKKPSDKYNDTDVQRIMEIFGDIEPEQWFFSQTVSCYYRILIDLMPLGYKCDAVQSTVKCLYKYILESSALAAYKERFTPLHFADHFCSSLIGSDLARINEQTYGKEGCLFIAHAIAYFGRYHLNN